MRHTTNVDYEIEQEGVAKHLLHNSMATQISKHLQLYCHGIFVCGLLIQLNAKISPILIFKEFFLLVLFCMVGEPVTLTSDSFS